MDICECEGIGPICRHNEQKGLFHMQTDPKGQGQLIIKKKVNGVKKKREHEGGNKRRTKGRECTCSHTGETIRKAMKEQSEMDA